WMTGGLLLTFFFAFLFFGLSHERPSATTSFGITVLGATWVGTGLGFLIMLRKIPDHGFWAVVAVLFTVFAADTAAYFFGRAIGTHRMAPVISPGKTWEGLVAGVVA